VAVITSFRELVVWQKSMELAEAVYRATSTLSAGDLFGIGHQIRRSAVSIPANIAEGFCRHSRAAYRSHVAIALGSHGELQTHLELCRRLALFPVDTLSEQATHVGRLLNGLWRALD